MHRNHLKKTKGGSVAAKQTKKEKKSKTVTFRIRQNSHLIKIILPIFDKYPLISNKQYDYLRFKENLLNEVKLYENLDINSKKLFEHRPSGGGVSGSNSNNVDSILALPYFSS